MSESIGRFEVRPGRGLAVTPRLIIGSRSLMVSPCQDGAAHERHVLATVGSGNWYQSEHDELRFSPSERVLESVWLHIPEVNADLAEPLARWRALPSTPGTLGLVGSDPFDQVPATTRMFGADGTLVCAYGAIASGAETRLEVAEGCSVVVGDGDLVGWFIEDAERFVVRSWEFPGSAVEDREFQTRMAEFFDLVAEPNLEALEDGEPDVIERLSVLRDGIDLGGGVQARRAALRETVAELVDFFG
ncbi:hypothetical protein [Actinokineospora alba]|nr:hypothetical protein [Actinokineospora alba]TDP67927.1 hypothetical protein C8E96_3485 [Actinokineospora alba]